MKYKVTMICREIWRAEIIIEHDNNDLEVIKDKAWEGFDVIKKSDLEQENFTKVQVLESKEKK